jgi:Ca2+-binding EF-hand superfamily protein
VNNDGKLSEKEMIAGFSKRMGGERATKYVETIFEKIDRDKSGLIDYTGNF